MFYVDTTRLSFFFRGPCAISTWRMCLIKSGEVMMRWCVRDDKHVWRGEGGVGGEGRTSRSVTQSSQPTLGSGKAFTASSLIGNVGFQRASWSPKISYNSSGHPIKRPEKFPFWSPFGRVSFIAPEMKSRLSLFIYLFSVARAQFALLHYEDTTAPPWFVCFLFQKKKEKKKRSVCRTILITFLKFGMTETGFRVPQSSEAPPV